MDYIIEKFAQIEDRRHSGYAEHSLVDALKLILSDVLRGLDGLSDIMVYIVSESKFFKEKFGI